MEQSGNPHELNTTRYDLIERLKSKDRGIMKVVEDWVLNEVKEAGFEGTPKGVIFGSVKEAALYFDAGFPGECMNTLLRAKIYAKRRDFLDEGDDYLRYFKTVSEALQDSLNQM